MTQLPWPGAPGRSADGRKEAGDEQPDDHWCCRERRGPAAGRVTFVTTEHFTLQGARAATIAESTGRATMFLGSVSAGLVALGLIAAATRIGATFYAFGVVVLVTLSFVGTVTFERVLQ
jgi:hypothetical protein